MNFVCGICGGEITIVEKDDDHTFQACPCGRTHCLHINKGTLDLGIVRDAVVKDRLDYRLWPDGTETVIRHE